MKSVYFAGSESNELKISSFLIALLSRRDWVYSLSLLVPVAAYILALRAYSLVASQSFGDSGLTRILHLMQSSILFTLGYSLLWIGLFAVARRELQRRTVVVLFHLSTILVVIVTTCAYWYSQETGTTLDYDIIASWRSRLDESELILAYRVPLSAWVLLAAALLYTAFGPPFLTRVVSRWRGWTRTSPSRAARVLSLGSLMLFLLALGFGSLSLLTGATAWARDPLVSVVPPGIWEATTEEVGVQETTTEAAGVEDTTAEVSEPGVDSTTGYPATDTSLAQTPETEKRNVVLIHLESARARSVTPYNEDLKTMPFLDELAKESLVAEQARVVVPRSSKGSTATNCGIEPSLFPGPEFEPAEAMEREGYQITNSFGYEEDIMLEPSEGWLSANGYDKPFLAQYFTGTGHYGYECVPNRYGYEYFSENEELDRYHNCLRMLDFFLKNLMDQYKEMGLYEDTIFVIFGDHGEGFREHGRSMHGDTIYDEGLRIPLIVHDPRRFEGGERVEGLSSQIDIMPTVLEMLGYRVRNGEYPGYSLLREPPEARTLRFSCITKRTCMASIQGYEKYIYHYENQPDELFDLSEDPFEQNDRAGSLSSEELEERREDLLEWRTRVNAVYGGEE